MGQADEKDGNWISRMLPPAFLFLALSLPPNRYWSHQQQHQPRLAALAPFHCSCCPLPGSSWQCCAVISHLVLHAATTPSSIAPPSSRVPVTGLHACVSPSYTSVTAGHPSVRFLSRTKTMRFNASYNTIIKLPLLPLPFISNQERLQQHAASRHEAVHEHVQKQPWLRSDANRNWRIPVHFYADD